LRPRSQPDSIKPRKKRDKGAEIFKATFHLKARAIPLEYDCTKSNKSYLLKKKIFYKILFF